MNEIVAELLDVIKAVSEFIADPDTDPDEVVIPLTGDYYRYLAEQADRQKAAHKRVHDVLANAKNLENYVAMLRLNE